MSTLDTSPQTISSEDRGWATACHLSPLVAYLFAVPGTGILCPMLVWLCRRDESEFVDEQGRRAINFQIMMALLALGSWLLVPILVGIPLLLAVHLIGGLFAVLAGLKTASGRGYDYPVSVDMVHKDSFKG